MNRKKQVVEPSGTDHKTIFRLFSLIQQLGQRHLKIGQIEQICGISRSTAYKYLKLLKDIGYRVEKTGATYHLNLQDGTAYGHLAAAEQALIHDALQSYAPDNPLKSAVLEKIGGAQDILPTFTHTLQRRHEAEMIAQLQHAVRHERRVILRGYQSANTQKLSDRLFEPKHFYPDYLRIIGVEVAARLETGTTKTFNIERIGRVEVLEQAQTLPFEAEKIDVFGWAGHEERVVSLRLTKRAKLILETDFPMARPYVTDAGGGLYQLKTFYTGYESVSRFILGLPGEIEVLGDAALQAHLAALLRRQDLKALTATDTQ